MRKKYGMSFIEILVALVILSTSILALYTVIWRGLMLLKRGESVEIATNIAQGQFEAYEGNFHFMAEHLILITPVILTHLLLTAIT